MCPQINSLDLNKDKFDLIIYCLKYTNLLNLEN